MMTLEHLKLLAPKAAQLSPGTGGSPTITFHEVSDMLSGCSELAARYARYIYAGESTQRNDIRIAVLILLLGLEKVRAQKMSAGYWLNQIDLAIAIHAHDSVPSQRRKARSLRRKHWRSLDEDNLELVVSYFNEADWEVRAAIREWNEKQID